MYDALRYVRQHWVRFAQFNNSDQQSTDDFLRFIFIYWTSATIIQIFSSSQFAMLYIDICEQSFRIRVYNFFCLQCPTQLYIRLDIYKTGSGESNCTCRIYYIRIIKCAQCVFHFLSLIEDVDFIRHTIYVKSNLCTVVF